MAETYVDVELIELDIPGTGLVVLDDAMSLSRTRTGESTVVFTMRRQKFGRGYRRAPKSFSWELEVARRVGGDEVDYRGMQDDNVVFQIYVEEGDGGQRRQLVDCTIDEVSDDTNAEGEATRRITGKALRERRDLANSPASAADLE